MALEQAGIGRVAGAQAWVVVFDTAEWLDGLQQAALTLDAWERARAARFRFEGDRTSYVLAHALWRRVLRMCLGTGPVLPRVSPDALGRPLLPDHPGHVTSLSRSGPFAAVAVARMAAVGLDIECFPARHALDDVLAAIGTPAERQALAGLAGEPWQRAVLGLWTAKEAVLKAWGTGLRFDPALVDTSRSPLPDPSGRPLAWRLLRLSLPAGLIGAIAVPGEPEALSICWLGAAGNIVTYADWTL
ncbi:4'-phosphopantetheinyl transferase family protein [Dyella thiooxydans]|uniref:4'-phosphopantetheinyl transferase family protein n=1 Tax=Dyella thiooxydans TaxID=445710 RepID=UPI001472319E|nr:4'-phosphopantetheinyl transferase superfamily protein [Dyella thiooxydans]